MESTPLRRRGPARPARLAAGLAALLLAIPFVTGAFAADAFAAAVPAAQDDEIVAEFKRYFRKYKDTPTRVEAVLSLEGVESVAVVGVLLPILADADSEVARAATRVLAGFDTRPPVDALLAELAETKDEALRAGILRVVAEGKYTGAAEAILPCLEDGSWEVRRRAVLALAEQGGDTVVAPIVARTGDAEPAVRCAALDSLARLRSGAVVEPALAALADASWQVRGSAIHALRDVRRKESIGPLIDRMAIEEGRLIADIGQALAELTGRDFGQRVDGWRGFWATYADRFEIPTDAELAALRAKRAESRARYDPPPGAVSYHGVETPSRSILFVIDVSGSMEQEVVEKERYKEGGYPSYKRIDIVKTELLRTIETLEPYVEFNIVSFATEARRWKPTQVKANVLNKDSARAYVRKLEAIGGSSKEELAAVGLTGSANLEAGRTNTYDALMNALEAGSGKKLEDDSYEVGVDTIFFLSDGRPSWGRFTDTDDILREVRAANELRKVVLHTIAIGEFQKSFMERLAQENGGVFVDLGK